MLVKTAHVIYERELAKRGIDEQRLAELSVDARVHGETTFLGDADQLLERALYEGEKVFLVSRPVDPWRTLVELRGCADDGCILVFATLLACPVAGMLAAAREGGALVRGIALTVAALPFLIVGSARLGRALALANRRYYVTDRRLIVVGGGTSLEVQRTILLRQRLEVTLEPARHPDVRIAGQGFGVLLERPENPEELVRALTAGSASSAPPSP